MAIRNGGTRSRADDGDSEGGSDWWKWLVGVAAGFILGLGVAVLYLVLIGGDDSDAVAGRVPENPEVELVLSEPFLTAIARRAYANADPPINVTDIRVDAQNDENALVVLGNASLLGGSTTGRIVLDPLVEDNMLNLTIREADLGILPLPGGLEDQLEAAINERLQAALDQLPATPTGVRVTDESLVVTAEVDPADLVNAAPDLMR